MGKRYHKKGGPRKINARLPSALRGKSKRHNFCPEQPLHIQFLHAYPSPGHTQAVHLHLSSYRREVRLNQTDSLQPLIPMC